MTNGRRKDGVSLFCKRLVESEGHVGLFCLILLTASLFRMSSLE